MVAIKPSLLALGFSTLAVAQYPPPGGSSTAAAPASSSTATATNNVIEVQVGNGDLTFNPSTVQGKVGDTINFHFYPPSHSVAESSFNSPCSYTQGGIWSGFMPTSSGVAVSSQSDLFV
jgi:plastocyanin